MAVARILFLSDTHLGFDMPFRPRIERRRRGADFFENFERALQAARAHRVDAVIHGGDVLYRSRVRAELVQMAFAPLKAIADEGIPVYVVPGNHERSSIPYRLLALHPGVFLFDRPTTHILETDGLRLALAGFPHQRSRVGERFADLVEETGWRQVSADVHLLCMHQAVEGAKVGPSNYMFRHGPDVVAPSDIPRGLVAVLSGHIHRHQVLTQDLRGRALPAPVLYPGSIERTSFAERNEPKGFVILDIETGHARGGRLRHWRFLELPTRPMLDVELHIDSGIGPDCRPRIRSLLESLPFDGVVRLRISRDSFPFLAEPWTAESLRSLVPPTMNVSVMWVEGGSVREFGPRSRGPRNVVSEPRPAGVSSPRRRVGRFP